jgi:pyruvate dehydrogenase E2 component (dihydrolipoamide acetyltransferase)
MAIEVKVPEIAENAESGTVTEILVSEGDTIEKDDSIIVMETDKASVEIPSSHGGTVKKIKVSEGDELGVGDVILTIEEDGDDGSDDEEDSSEEKSSKKTDKKKAKKGEKQDEEDIEEEDEDEDEENADSEDDEDEEVDEEIKEENKRIKDKAKKKSDDEEDVEEEDDDDQNEGDEASDEEEEDDEDEEEKIKEEKKKTKDKAKKKTDEEEDIEEEAGNDQDEGDEEEEEADEDGSSGGSVEKTTGKKGQQKEVPAAPSVRMLARELGINIQKVSGTGPGNRISSDDVKAYAREVLSQSEYGEEAELPDFSQWGETERQPLSKIRQTIAKGTQASWQAIPHVTQFDKADITGLEKFRKEQNEQAGKEAPRLTVTAILLKIAALALKNYPKFNSSLDSANDELVLKNYVNIGVAVATDRGLLMPVIDQVDKKTIPELAAELVQAAKKARDFKLSPEDMQGGNFVISNQGGIGGTNFTPIIFQPNVAILGVSEASMQPVWQGEGFKPRLILPLSLSYDHRVIDGAEAAEFLRWICNALQNPLNVWMEGGAHGG